MLFFLIFGETTEFCYITVFGIMSFWRERERERARERQLERQLERHNVFISAIHYSNQNFCVDFGIQFNCKQQKSKSLSSDERIGYKTCYLIHFLVQRNIFLKIRDNSLPLTVYRSPKFSVSP